MSETKAKSIVADAGQADTPEQRQHELTLAGQRNVNIIWEVTQALISGAVVLATVAVGCYVAFTQEKPEVPDVLSSAFFLVVGFYFSRTNHTAIGGTGPKPVEEYKGR